MSHSPSNGNPFSSVWSISLRREAYRHAGLNPWLSFSRGRTSRQQSRWKDRNNQQRKVLYAHFETKQRKRADYFLLWTIFSLERADDRILMQSMLSTEPWVIANWVSSMDELSDLNDKSRESSRIRGKIRIHGSLIFTYTSSRGELDCEAGLLV